MQQFESPAGDVTVTIVPDPKEETDFFRWRCMSGERFPPTLAPTFFAYGSWAGRPAVKAGVGTVSSPGVTSRWPVLPRIGFGQSAVGTVTWEFNVAIDTTAFFNNGNIFLGQYVRFDYRTDTNTWDFVTTSGTTVTTHAASALNNFAWHAVSVSVTAAGAVTYQLDGVTLASYTMSNPSLFNGADLQPSWTAFGNAGLNAYIANMTVTWT